MKGFNCLKALFMAFFFGVITLPIMYFIQRSWYPDDSLLLPALMLTVGYWLTWILIEARQRA